MSRNPVSDRTGAFAAEGQPADVWFLAGTFGGAAHRRCVVPAGRPLFFPLINMFRNTFLFVGLKAPVLPHASGSAELNGMPLESHAVTNQRKFPVAAVTGGPFGVSGRLNLRAWGLWSHVDGLGPGDYVLEIRGEAAPGGFWVRVGYELTVT